MNGMAHFRSKHEKEVLMHAFLEEAQPPPFAAPASHYEADFLLWLKEQVELLRARQFAGLDLENLIEELGSAVRHEKRALASRLRVLIVHLLKCEFQPGKKTRGWQNTIVEQRIQIDELILDSPSLRRMLPESAQRVYQAAVRKAAMETRLPESAFPEQLPYSEDQLLDGHFYP
jgi:hypothetical protein